MEEIDIFSVHSDIVGSFVGCPDVEQVGIHSAFGIFQRKPFGIGAVHHLIQHLRFPSKPLFGAEICVMRSGTRGITLCTIHEEVGGQFLRYLSQSLFLTSSVKNRDAESQVYCDVCQTQIQFHLHCYTQNV